MALRRFPSPPPTLMILDGREALRQLRQHVERPAELRHREHLHPHPQWMCSVSTTSPDCSAAATADSRWSGRSRTWCSRRRARIAPVAHLDARIEPESHLRPACHALAVAVQRRHAIEVQVDALPGEGFEVPVGQHAGSDRDIARVHSHLESQGRLARRRSVYSDVAHLEHGLHDRTETIGLEGVEDPTRRSERRQGRAQLGEARPHGVEAVEVEGRALPISQISDGLAVELQPARSGGLQAVGQPPTLVLPFPDGQWFRAGARWLPCRYCCGR